MFTVGVYIVMKLIYTNYLQYYESWKLNSKVMRDGSIANLQQLFGVKLEQGKGQMKASSLKYYMWQSHKENLTAIEHEI